MAIIGGKKPKGGSGSGSTPKPAGTKADRERLEDWAKKDAAHEEFKREYGVGKKSDDSDDTETDSGE